MSKEFLILLLSVFVLFAKAQNAPVANNDTFQININQQTTLPVTSNDFDLDGDPLTVTVVVQPINGTALVLTNNVVYTPNNGFSGFDSLFYSLCDTTGLCDTASVFINVVGANLPPVAQDDYFTIPINTPSNFNVANNDFDPEADALSISILSGPSHGSASVNGTSINYTPTQGYAGFDTIVYVICDILNQCDTANVYITITGSNSPPIAQDDYYVIPMNAQSIFNVANNDFDPDADPLSVSILSGPSHGSASVNGTSVNYTPNQGYSGYDTLIYVICDTLNQCDTATVYITINGTNQPPTVIVTSVLFSDTVNQSLINLGASDPDGDSLYIGTIRDLDSANNLGTLSAHGVDLVFTRTPLSCGTETFEYDLCDAVQCYPHQITITISCPEDIFHTQGFSPNGDGLNDRLVFTGLEYFGPATIKIFNRYGTIVYESEDYRNDWDGTFIDSGNPLPDGTYYYTLVLSDKRKFVDYLILNR
jgi:gliding motility-associated-like protein